MKKLSLADFQNLADRRKMRSAADAAQILFFAERAVEKKIGRNFSYRATIFRGGIVFFAVENSAAAEKMRSAFFFVLPALQKEFPDAKIREMRTKIETF